MPPAETARDELAANLAVLSDLAADLVKLVRADDPPSPGRTLVGLRELRVLTLCLTTRHGIRFELATVGADWAIVADALGIPEDAARARYAGEYEDWAFGIPIGPYPGLPDHLPAPAPAYPTEPEARDNWLTGWVLRRWRRATTR